MQQIQVFTRHLVVVVVAVCLLIFFQNQYPQYIGQWLSQLPLLPVFSLVACALLAWHFARSRLTWVCLLLLIPLLPVSANSVSSTAAIPNDLALLAIAANLALLAWCKDRGFHPINLLITLVQIMIVTTIVILGLPWLEQQPQLTALISPLYQLPVSLLQGFSPLWLVCILALLLATTLRLYLKPNNSQAMILAAVIVLPSIQYCQQPLMTSLLLSGIGLYGVFAILMDSHNMAYKDELTGIASRRALMQYVQTLGRQYVVVMSDIDHFKAFNDTHGHDVGDQVLRLVASKLNKVSGGGKAFRYGGEEFTLVFPRKNLAQAQPYVEELRQQIADYQMTLRSAQRPAKKPKKGKNGKAKARSEQKPLMVTCSFGMAERSGKGEFEAMLKQADEALYQAKKAGRNCVKPEVVV